MFLSEVVESAKRPHTLHESKALNMGIAELEPCQLAPTVGKTGAGSTGSLVPSTLQEIHHQDLCHHRHNLRIKHQDL
jgi:hypothetical protein